ncbi:APC family permease [Agrococcus sp. TF02-05]|uniref:APC family permease n=1 Tax=Agrococcus sp. TF02-05 TaxID=2815211 RepID=UPI001AA11A3D|nr:APC family permease [Agrococcus sp. TF02-05]MBO1768590.1 APC family permease [Agrococcus sp. TF02-05]
MVTATRATDEAVSNKGLAPGTVGVLGAVVIGVSTIAPAYTFTAAIGPTVSAVGVQVPAIILLGFVPMLLVAFGYRELNRAMPDAGTSFTWATRAFGPYVGWMAGWGLVIATVLVLSNLAGIAVDFLYLLIAQITGNESIAELAANPFINVITCLAFMAAATFISYRDIETTQRVQLGLVAFQVLVLLVFGITALVRASSGEAIDHTPIDPSWFNVLQAPSVSAVIAGLSLSIFIFWGWDVVLTMNEEAKDPARTPGRAAALTIVVVLGLYLLLAIALLAFAGNGETGLGLGNPDIQDNVLFFLSDPIMGPLGWLISLAVLSSSAASLQSTALSPARTLLAMGHYGAVPARFATVHPRYRTPGFAAVVAALVASGFYAVMRFVSENVLWDTITALGMMVCFYYGLTALSAVWYFRKTATSSVKAFFVQLLCPLVGGVMLVVLFVQTLVDSLDPAYGSGSDIGGVGLVGILGVGMLLLGVVLMLIMRKLRPAFFRGEVLPMGFNKGDLDTKALFIK